MTSSSLPQNHWTVGFTTFPVDPEKWHQIEIRGGTRTVATPDRTECLRYCPDQTESLTQEDPLQPETIEALNSIMPVMRMRANYFELSLSSSQVVNKILELSRALAAADLTIPFHQAFGGHLVIPGSLILVHDEDFKTRTPYSESGLDWVGSYCRYNGDVVVNIDSIFKWLRSGYSKRFLPEIETLIHESVHSCLTASPHYSEKSHEIVADRWPILDEGICEYYSRKHTGISPALIKAFLAEEGTFSLIDPDNVGYKNQWFEEYKVPVYQHPYYGYAREFVRWLDAQFEKKGLDVDFHNILEFWDWLHEADEFEISEITSVLAGWEELFYNDFMRDF